GVDQRRRAPHDSLDRFLSDQRKIGYRKIYPNFKLAGCDFLVRRDAKLSAACLVCPLDECWNDVDADCPDAVCRQRAREPSFAATDVEDRARRSAQYCIDDRLFGDESATRDLVFPDGSRPWRGVPEP